METVDYLPGRQLDVHGEGDRGVALLWHGRGPDNRGALADLGGQIADAGLRVVVPDWDSHADDAGRSELLASLRHARGLASGLGLDPSRLVVGGWSLGGTAALDLVLHASELDLPPVRTVLFAPGDGPDAVGAFSGEALPAQFPAGADFLPVDVVLGVDDDVTEPAMVTGLVDRLRASGWATTLTEVEADHWTIAYDPTVAQTIVAATSSP